MGSDETKLRTTIQRELKITSSASVEISTKVIDVKTVIVSCNTNNINNNILNITLVQKQAETAVKKGENAGRVIRHINIVRDFKKLIVGKSTNTVNLSIPDGLSSKDFRVIAFVQNKDDSKVMAVAEKDL